MRIIFLDTETTGNSDGDRLCSLAVKERYVDEPLVSIDFNHNPHSSNYDSLQTKVYGKWVKVLAWYDNEWGFSNRMLDNTLALMSAK